MTDPEIEVLLAKAVQSVRGSAGVAWDEFMQALVFRADNLTDKLVLAGAGDIQRVQGAVQEARALLHALAMAPQLAEQLYEKERRDRHVNGSGQQR